MGAEAAVRGSPQPEGEPAAPEGPREEGGTARHVGARVRTDQRGEEREGGFGSGDYVWWAGARRPGAPQPAGSPARTLVGQAFQLARFPGQGVGASGSPLRGGGRRQNCATGEAVLGPQASRLPVMVTTNLSERKLESLRHQRLPFSSGRPPLDSSTPRPRLTPFSPLCYNQRNLSCTGRDGE
jgi:hypothetical protein